MGFRVNGCGTYDKTIELCFAGSHFCPSCNQEKQFAVYEMQRKITVIYVPVARISKEYAVLCESYQKGYSLTETQMHQARANDLIHIHALLGSNHSTMLAPAPTAEDGHGNEIETQDSVKCPRCANEVEKQMEFCPRCGTSIQRE